MELPALLDCAPSTFSAASQDAPEAEVRGMFEAYVAMADQEALVDRMTEIQIEHPALMRRFTSPVYRGRTLFSSATVDLPEVIAEHWKPYVLGAFEEHEFECSHPRHHVCWMAEGWSAARAADEAAKTARLLAEAGVRPPLPYEDLDRTRAELAARLQEWERAVRLLDDRGQDAYRNRLDPVFLAGRQERRASAEAAGATRTLCSDTAADARESTAGISLGAEADSRLRRWSERHCIRTELMRRRGPARRTT